MEAFRRLGIAVDVREAGLPADFPNDCVYRPTVTDPREITRIPIPGRSERRTSFEGPDTWWPTPEPACRVNQIYLEPVIYAHVEPNPLITLHTQCEFVSATQDEHQVKATVKALNSGEMMQIDAPYMIGCDGSRSLIRKLIGARFEGDAVVQRVQSSLIRAPGLLAKLHGRPGWMNLSLNPRRSGNTIAIDGKELWLIHCYLHEHEDDFSVIDRDAQIRTILGVDESFEYELISNEDWIGRRLVANRFRDRRIFICGDSAHLWVPYAGYGMNAGIADAMNLSWLLAATLNNWGGKHLLDAYEIERQPITEQVSRFAMNHALGALAHRREVPPEIEDDGELGRLARERLGKEIYEFNVQQYCAGGLNFGYFYDRSHLVAYDGENHPGYTMSEFCPSTVPGCRTPHFWLQNGRSAYDVLGVDYTLLRFDTKVDARPLLDAAAARGVPVKLLDIKADERTSVYKHTLLLSRPDAHVAWRGNSIPDDVIGLVDCIRGARAPQIAP
jgi:2-polyprenyl-6-methoxyphenol hydroxylase-like FAD-dependent oxidoreductase